MQYDGTVNNRSQLEALVAAMSRDHKWVVRFHQRVGPGTGPRNCRLWTGFVNKRSGYGQYSITRTAICKPTSLYVHRVAWILEHGIIPDGMTIDHDVDNGCAGYTCCVPDHMELVTLAENGRRACATRWGAIGDQDVCRRGHRGERKRSSTGAWYCLACGREDYAAKKAA